MDALQIATVAVSASLLASAFVLMALRVRAIRFERQAIWHGIMLRGYVEAEKTGVLKRSGNPQNPWIVSASAAQIYEQVKPTLIATKNKMALELGHQPTDDDLAWTFELELQQWFVEHGCPNIGTNQHGCLAVACVIAKEAV